MTDAARWLAAETRSTGVAAIGLGLGGTVTTRSVAAGAPIEQLVLWATPALGRTFLRELRAFGSIQRSLYGVEGDAGSDLPPGWQEIGGFVLSAEARAAIEAIDLTALQLGSLRRVLLLERDGLPVDPGLAARLRDAGVTVTIQRGDGWGAMHFHPERPQPPLDVIARVGEWLGSSASSLSKTASSTEGDSRVAPVVADDHLDLTVDGVAIRETSLEEGSFFAIAARPLDGRTAKVCAVFLNAGAVRRIGPNRMWVDAARRWAVRGLATVRVDVEGIGDADGDEHMYADVGHFYTANRGSQVSAILDTLEQLGLGSSFALIGLCAGAYSGFSVARTIPGSKASSRSIRASSCGTRTSCASATPRTSAWCSTAPRGGASSAARPRSGGCSRSPGPRRSNAHGSSSAAPEHSSVAPSTPSG